MSEVRAVPCTVAGVPAGDTVRLVLRLGWGVTLTATCKLAGVQAATPDSPEGAKHRDLLRAALDSVAASGAALTFTAYDFTDDRATGQLIVTDAAGNRHDVAASVYPDD